MRKSLLFLILAAIALGSTPAARAQGYTDTLLTSINYNTDFPCGNNAGTATGNIQQSLKAAAHFGGGTVDLTCYQGAITITADVFSSISTPILLYLPEHAVTVNANATIPANFEICGGPGASITHGIGFTLTNNAAACFNGFLAGTPPGGANGTIQYNHAGTFGGILNSSVDPSTGDMTLGAGLTVLSPDGLILVLSDYSAGIFLASNGNLQIVGKAGAIVADSSATGVTLDSTPNGGSGPVNLTSAGGVSITDNSASGIVFWEQSLSAGILLNNWASPGTDTLANLTTQKATLPSEGFSKNCSDCDTPPYAGAVCTAVGDHAGAQAFFIQGALYCIGKVSNTWDFTSNAVALSFINTTAATSLANQSSPLQVFQGNIWGSGAASVDDGWEVGVVIANGTNGESLMDFLHFGGVGDDSVGAVGAPMFFPAARHVSTLPTASSYPGHIANVDNSTTVAVEGQTCVDAGGGGGPALAFSNGTVWKCF